MTTTNEILERRLGLALDFQGSLAADLKQMRAWRNKWRTRTREWRDKTHEAVHAMRALRSELAEVREQTAHLEKTLASTTSAWDAEVEARSKVARQTAERVAKVATDLRTQLEAAVKRADLAEAMLESVRAAVAKPALDKEDTRPKIGDTVPWSEMEDGLYHRPDYPYPFAMVVGSRVNVVDHDDRAVARMLDGSGRGQLVSSTDPEWVVFVARDLGTDPEAWRAAMREHLAKVGK